MSRVEKAPRMTFCGTCRGYGITHGHDGGVRDCPDCEGAGIVPARDAKGRFLPWEIIAVTEAGKKALEDAS